MPTQTAADRKRRDILDAAADLFLDTGYDRVTMDLILERVGGSKRTLYRHFPCKEALFEAMVKEVADRVLVALRPEVDEQLDVRTTLRRAAQRYLEVLLSREGLALYRTMAAASRQFPDLSAAFYQQGPARATAHMATLVAQEVERGRLRVDDPLSFAGALLGAVRGDIHMKAVFTGVRMSRSEIADAAEAAVDAFLVAAGIPLRAQ